MARKTIVCIGDSITLCDNLPAADRWSTRIGGDRWIVLNAGIDGDTSELGLARFRRDVLDTDASIAIIAFGINDANVRSTDVEPRVSVQRYRKNVSEMVRLTLRGGTAPIILVNHPPQRGNGRYLQGNGRSYAVNFQPYVFAAREIAAATETACIDIPEISARRGISWDNLVIEDGLHLNLDGSYTYARMVCEEFSGAEKI